MGSSWGNSWLSSWANSWDGAESPATTIRSGGAVIVELPSKRKKKKPQSIESSRVISKEEAAGMAAIYGSQMRVAPVDFATEIEQEIDIEPISDVFELPKNIFRVPDLPGKNIDSLLMEADKPDDIALILAIIEAIG